MTIGGLSRLGELRRKQGNSKRTNGSPLPRQRGRASAAHEAPGCAVSRRVHNQCNEDLRLREVILRERRIKRFGAPMGRDSCTAAATPSSFSRPGTACLLLSAPSGGSAALNGSGGKWISPR